MTEPTIVWAPRAVAQLLEGLAFIARDKPQAAHDLGSRVVEEISLLQRFPQASRKGPCQKSHFLVMIADRDHILYEYLVKENGPAIYQRFRGFSGHVQAVAKSVFNLLFADEEELALKAPGLEHDGCTRIEVGCWAHCRRRFWEAAVAKSDVGREGLVRLGRIFELDESWKDKPPSEIKRLRQQHLRVHVDSFFSWIDEQRELFAGQRGYTRTALEYANNQREALTRFFDDGRLVLTNNGAERGVKAIALGRKAWLFCGSDDHAKSTAALYSLVASARLHRLDAEEYLRCLIRLVPIWPFRPHDRARSAVLGAHAHSTRSRSARRRVRQDRCPARTARLECGARTAVDAELSALSSRPKPVSPTTTRLHGAVKRIR